jgi:hypothetical protein
VVLGVFWAAGCSAGADEVRDATAASTQLPALHDRAFYASVAEGAGVDTSRTFVVGLRGVSRDGTRHDVRTLQKFDDVVAVVSPGAVVEMAASTHPWFARSSAAPDVNGDGVGDVGMIRPGRYHAEPRPPARDLAGAPTFHVLNPAGTEGLPGWRDTNHDGIYDDAEKRASEARGDTLTDVLFHQGGAGAPAPIGCQVLGAGDVRAFVAALGGRNTTFEYVLVDAP